MPNKKLILNTSKPKIYCGNSNTLPDEYDDFGTLYTCLQKGFGAGKNSCTTSDKPKELSMADLQQIAKLLGIPITTKRGKKKPTTLLKNIITVVEDLE